MATKSNTIHAKCAECGKYRAHAFGDLLCVDCRKEADYVRDEREAIQLENVPFAYNPGRLGS